VIKHKLFNLVRANARNPARKFGIQDKATGGGPTDLYLYDVIVDSDATAEWWGGVSAESFVKTLHSLRGNEVNLHINSPGGDAFAGRAMATAIYQHDSDVHTMVEGYAASAASTVAIAGHQRSIADGSFLMIHNAWTFAMGNKNDLNQVVSLLTKIDSNLAKDYARRSNLNEEQASAAMSAETWYDAEQALAAGFSTHALESAQNCAAGIAWDLSEFANAPKAQAPKADYQKDLTEPERARMQRAVQIASAALYV
jgi:ATP-dependent Clp protease protease subunit